MSACLPKSTVTPCSFRVFAGALDTVSHVALKPLVKKQMSAWRPITARLVLLKKLVIEFGLEGGSGLAAGNIMSFIQVSGVDRFFTQL